MTMLRVILEGESAFEDLKGKEDKVIHLTGPFIVAALESGMKPSGAPSLAIRIDLPDGRTVIQETSLKLWYTATRAFKGKFGDLGGMI